ncbi:uncharacterized protein LOC141679804 [Apium graveolens]|uniref:uncharacterized protein LOC141679804 n=1 Tax=Apium graveolens TaxID=4045 RepID=UPI003D7A1611
MEVYVDEMLVKSLSKADHINHLREAFEVLRHHKMLLNPTKCAFGVGSKIFLDHMVSKRGIEANPDKIKSILDMELPHSIKDIQKLTGRIAALGRFISKSGDKCLPFFKTFRKVKFFEWIDESQEAFEQLMKYMTEAPLLAKPSPEDTLYLYLVRPRSRGQEIVTSEGEKEKGKDKDTTLKEYWVLHFDGASKTKYSGAGLVLQSLDGFVIEYVLKLDIPTMNNEAEYEALIAGLSFARIVRTKNLKVCGDSRLVIAQVNGEFEAKDDTMAKYLRVLKGILTQFDEWYAEHVSREENTTVDALSKFASSEIENYLRSIYFQVLKTPTIHVINLIALFGVARSFVILYLKFLRPLEAEETLKEAHEGIYGQYLGGRSLTHKITRLGFYWLTILSNVKAYSLDDNSIELPFTSVAHPQANRQAEVANKIILDGLKKSVERSSNTCADELLPIL